jgi:hypothetical protein
MLAVAFALALPFQGASATMEKRQLLQLAVVAPGGAEEAYLLEVTSDHVLKASFGRGITLGNNGFSALEQKSVRSAVIDGHDWAEIEKLSRDVAKLGTIADASIVKDDWQMNVRIRGNSISVYRTRLEKYPKVLGELVRKIMTVSPLKIELRGFA